MSIAAEPALKSAPTLRWTAGEIDRAAETLAQGRLVAFPTETVYGLGGDGGADAAVAAIYAAKGRPRFNPLILHVAGLEEASALAALPPGARLLAERFWPGPLTLVAPARSGAPISALAQAGLSSVALRAPAHPLAQALLTAFGGPLAGPSANPSGAISPTTADHVLAGLAGRIAGVLDGGPCVIGVESSIVGFDGDRPVLLRPGGLAAETIEAALGRPLGRPGGAITAPGQLTSHYAPKARLRLNADEAEKDEALLGFGPTPGAALNLSPSGDTEEAAANLFAMLRALDARADAIAVSPVPERGLGNAINDRLRRAAAPRP
ncbi:threonylcarbamoyl-AMP synthase [Pikeienuella piscinae]|uniref:Threonylcarbamoyl-AMP synthase n=1 Tax=Pikeienuella piscinae TaxID=2748098 RepID=A0A7M3T661_9RHOB|nr:L-threonylcarbamoyladenylate synthase [Pikeienuella piscinae]QIE57492.1 threonylcarbamoyl-AMP synthase [Pikeienuella piscinae]